MAVPYVAKFSFIYIILIRHLSPQNNITQTVLSHYALIITVRLLLFQTLTCKILRAIRFASKLASCTSSLLHRQKM